ncbi:MAG: family 78 glycoside hydrolase catalytic domain [Acidobacteria bacterium]|nr:family 78 glycoside hydrolase catalytic domain [Acidobacteriota bacterium]
MSTPDFHQAADYSAEANQLSVLQATALHTDYQRRPLAVTTTPTFTWQLLGQGRDALQTAFQLAVFDADGKLQWDSGIRSEAQQRCGYAGPQLEPDADYTWRLQIRNCQGVLSPWSEPAEFSTGPLAFGGATSPAMWISRAPGGRSAVSIMDGNLRVAAASLLRLPFEPAADFTLRTRVRIAMGGLTLLLRGTDSTHHTGTTEDAGKPQGIALRLNRALECSWVNVMGTTEGPESERVPVLVGPDASPTWHEFEIRAAGSRLAVSVDGRAVSEFQTATTGRGFLAISQAPREQAEFSSFTLQTAQGTTTLDFPQAGLDGWDLTISEREIDEWTLLRGTVPLRGKVTRARLYAAGCHQFELYVNGTSAGRGGSFSYAGEGRYQTFDVAELLQDSSSATIAVLLHWFGPGQGRAPGAPGLLAQLSLTYQDGSRAFFETGPDWMVASGPYEQSGYRNDEGDPVEHLRAPGWPQGSPDAWRQPDFDDSAWLPALVSARDTQQVLPLLPQETALKEEYVSATRMLQASDGTLVADFGRVLPGRPVVEFIEGIAGRIVHLRAGYTLGDGGRVAQDKLQTQNTDMSFPYTQQDGPQEYHAFTHLGFRYLEIPGIDAGALGAVGAVVVHGKHPFEGILHSSDPDLNAVLKLLADSTMYGIQEQFVDTPTREKGQFLGDAVNISYAAMALLGDRAYTRTALREFAASARRYWSTEDERGRYNAVYPNGDGKRDIPDFSLQMVEWALEYHRQSGDVAMLEELYPQLSDTAGYVLRHAAENGPTAGLVTDLGGGSGPYLHGIVDWPAPGRFGYDLDTAARTTVNAQAYGVLDGVARLSELLGRPAAETAHYRTSADNLAAAMNSRLRVSGRFVDGLRADGSPSLHASSHATSFPLSLGVTEPEFWTSDADYLASRGMRQGPMTVHRLFRALLRAGQVQPVVNLLTSTDGPGWMRILAAGGTFTWEAWELVEGTDYSQSHAWSASVLREIVEHLLGVQPAEPGAARLHLAPPMCSLEGFSGTVPTERGPVSLEWKRNGGTLSVRVQLPAGTTASLTVPAGSYRVTGTHTYSYVSGPDIELVPGSWDIQPVS